MAPEVIYNLRLLWIAGVRLPVGWFLLPASEIIGPSDQGMLGRVWFYVVSTIGDKVNGRIIIRRERNEN